MSNRPGGEPLGEFTVVTLSVNMNAFILCEGSQILFEIDMAPRSGVGSLQCPVGKYCESLKPGQCLGHV